MREITAGASPKPNDEILAIVRSLNKTGAQAVILGCTDIALLIKPEDSALPVFDTTALHAQAAVDWAIESA